MARFAKQLFSLGMASIFATGSCIPALAAGTEDSGIQTHESIQAPGSGTEDSSVTSLTIENPAEGHQYKAYQVFKGKVSSDGTKLSNVQYGANYTGREGMTLDQELAELEAEGADAKAFAEAVRNLLAGDPAAVLTKENPSAELEAGYYIIIDESTYEGSGDSLSDYIVAVVGNVKVQPKSTGVPGFDKSIDENKDQQEETDILAFSGIIPRAYASGGTGTIIQPGATAPSDSIDIEDDDTSVNYGIGDSIPYKLTATMPEAITAYKKYKLVFHDKLSAGLDYDRNSLKVFAGSTEIPTENYTVAYSEDGKSLTVSINDAKAAPWNAVPGTEIVVKYSAVLNENAEVKNRNEAWLEYSNDPKGDGTGETGPGVPDTVDVYTFEIRFDKVDKNGDPLAGAGFTLYRKDETDVFHPFGEEVKGVTRFSFKGLAAGEYKLVETTTPDGYNTMEDFVFRIDAETADGTDGKIKRITMVPVSGGAGAWTAVAADKAFEADIANYTGSTLPSTGGIGTYAFYLAGAAMVITIGVAATARKKTEE